MTRLRMRVAERLKGAQNTAALLTTFNEIDMSSLMEMRSTYKVRSTGHCCNFFGSQKACIAMAVHILAPHPHIVGGVPLLVQPGLNSRCDGLLGAAAPRVLPDCAAGDRAVL